MSQVSDIIDKTKPVWGACYYTPLEQTIVNEFESVFDPEHVALMESVIEAVDAAEIYGGEPGCDTADIWQGTNRLFDAVDALAKYRREHGLV